MPHAVPSVSRSEVESYINTKEALGARTHALMIGMLYSLTSYCCISYTSLDAANTSRVLGSCFHRVLAQRDPLALCPERKDKDLLSTPL